MQGLCLLLLSITVHICQYLCISVNICTYVSISVHISVYLTALKCDEVNIRMERACSLKTLSLLHHTWQRAFDLVTQDRCYDLWAISWPTSWCKRGRSWRAISVTDPMLIACCLPIPHGVGDRPRISCRQKRQPSQDMGDWDYVHHWVWSGCIEQSKSIFVPIWAVLGHQGSVCPGQ